MTGEVTMSEIDADYEARAQALPFGNSRFQNLVLVAGQYEGPARQVRALLLRLRDRREALRAAEFQLQRCRVEIDRLKHKIDQGGLDRWDQALAEIDLAERTASLPDTRKLYEDCLREIADLHAAIQAYPVYSREEFEALENDHFEAQMLRQIATGENAAGSKDTLIAVAKAGSAQLPSALGYAGDPTRAVAALLQLGVYHHKAEASDNGD